ncbi:MAG: hypothetical protein JSS02_19360, partial [Planctomycetes bacterium]|nr:hypothetical protein [Planctomycetota bacterium]
MRRKSIIGLILGLSVFVSSGAQASTIDTLTGPTVAALASHIGGPDTSWGIDFKALQNTTLLSFDFVHRGVGGAGGSSANFFGTIKLIDVTAAPSLLYTYNYAKNAPGVITYGSLSVPLIVNHIYRLEASSNRVNNTNDEVWATSAAAGFPAYPVANTVISVTRGFFSSTPLPTSFQSTRQWGAFRNIVTRTDTQGPVVVPEPASVLVFGFAAMVVG